MSRPPFEQSRWRRLRRSLDSTTRSRQWLIRPGPEQLLDPANSGHSRPAAFRKFRPQRSKSRATHGEWPLHLALIHQVSGTVARAFIDRLSYVCQPSLDVPGKRIIHHNRRPKFKWRIGCKPLLQLDDMQIVVQIGPTAAMVGATGDTDAGSAFAPPADSSDVLTLATKEENVGAAVPALSSPLELSARGCKGFKVEVVGDGDHEVYVLWIWLVCGQGADQRDSKHAGKAARRSYEGKRLEKQELPQGRHFMFSTAHEWRLLYAGNARGKRRNPRSGICVCLTELLGDTVTGRDAT